MNSQRGRTADAAESAKSQRSNDCILGHTKSRAASTLKTMSKLSALNSSLSRSVNNVYGASRLDPRVRLPRSLHSAHIHMKVRHCSA